MTELNELINPTKSPSKVVPFDAPILEDFQHVIKEKLKAQGYHTNDIFQVIGEITQLHQRNQTDDTDAYPTMIAGGAVRSYFDDTPIKDIDLFISHQELIQVIADNAGLHYRVVWRCPHDDVITIAPIRQPDFKIQVMPLMDDPANGIAGDPPNTHDAWQHVIRRFDIGACCAGVTIQATDTFNRNYPWHVRQGGALPMFFSDVSKRHITLNTVEYPVATMRRITKYVQKGYMLTSAALFTLIRSVHEHSDLMPRTLEEFMSLDTDSPFARYPLD